MPKIPNFALPSCITNTELPFRRMILLNVRLFIMPTMLLKSVSTSHAVRKGTGMTIVASTRKVSSLFSTATRISGFGSERGEAHDQQQEDGDTSQFGHGGGALCFWISSSD
ncbi:MAG: hypothetical protein IPK44_21280 [Candidatus Accumulibacter sp.]|uniref:hypothetical protein n=1 Tax=Accumulibacter sp. TaxID=2053492 RepID=UPI00258E93ED|nr:hypothetical protein [Accumulibacter sp.]MBK8116853.1 hypothetical protein [Accumulibacter sp.]